MNETINETLNYTAMYMKEAATADTATSIAIGCGILAIGAGAIAVTQIKKRKETKAYKEAAEKAKEELIQAIKDLKENKEIKEININNLPEDIQEEVLKTDPFFKRMFGKENKTGEPYLLWIDSNLNAKIKKNAKEGTMDYTMTDIEKTEGSAIFSNNKLITVKIGSKKRKFWIHYEKNAESYPIQEGVLASLFRKLVMAIKLTGMGQAIKKKKFPKVLLILGLLGVLAAILYFSGAFDKLLGSKEAVEAAVNTTVANATGFGNEITPVQGA